jgi:hypothetical protein
LNGTAVGSTAKSDSTPLIFLLNEVFLAQLQGYPATDNLYWITMDRHPDDFELQAVEVEGEEVEALRRKEIRSCKRFLVILYTTVALYLYVWVGVFWGDREPQNFIEWGGAIMTVSLIGYILFFIRNLQNTKATHRFVASTWGIKKALMLGTTEKDSCFVRYDEIEELARSKNEITIRSQKVAPIRIGVEAFQSSAEMNLFADCLWRESGKDLAKVSI